MKSERNMQVLLASPRGFCAGVERAIEIVERALERYGAPIYVLHEIVHNRQVIEDFRGRGVRFVEDLEQVPEGSVAIFSAHGVPQAAEEIGAQRGLRIIDATCPLVTKVHVQAQRHGREDLELVLIGHAGHPEIEGTLGRTRGTVHVLCSVEEVAALEVRDPKRLAYVTQTTLSVDDTRTVVQALKDRFPLIQGPELEDICYATQNRAERRARPARSDRRPDRRRLSEQLELQPPTRARRTHEPALLPDRLRRRPRAHLVRHRNPHRPHRRGLRPRKTGRCRASTPFGTWASAPCASCPASLKTWSSTYPLRYAE